MMARDAWRGMVGLVIAAAVGCAGGSGRGDHEGGDAGLDSDAMDDGSSGLFCATASRWIYLLTFSWVEEPVPGVSPGVSRSDLVRFEPDSETLTPLGEIDCPDGEGPSSMTVDRSGRALIYFQASSTLHRLDLEDMSCEKTAYDSEVSEFGHFTPAFVLDTAASEEELYVSGRVGATDVGMLAKMDPATFEITPVGEYDGYGSITGNALGEIWALRANMSPRYVYELDKATGDVKRMFDAAEIDTPQSSGASGYAFAFWGGSYYLFYRSASNEDGTSGIWRLDPETGDIENVFEESGHTIVGAGVSTCAPVVLL